ncbi:16168_t:CDS:2 [Gigaspora margarita]|uniref:16168_t:CDS:1 n=1 Tax=Gigaspora margarita TaxID=4874 RepID=A0ABN7VKW2_GIGMA|nr:16168_t:CDS:2 [Gigaspora margarita]
MDVGDGGERFYVGRFLPKSNIMLYPEAQEIELDIVIKNDTKSRYIIGIKVRKILDNNFINYIGHGSTYSSKYYLNSNIQSTSLDQNSSHNITLEVSAQEYFIEEGTEQR